MVLSSPPHPIFHLGMAGNTVIRGKEAPTYRAPRAKSDPSLWPPKYAKIILTFEGCEKEWAFCDSRRLGRIKMSEADDPLTVPPLSLLGEEVPICELRNVLTDTFSFLLIQVLMPICRCPPSKAYQRVLRNATLRSRLFFWINQGLSAG